MKIAGKGLFVWILRENSIRSIDVTRDTWELCDFDKI